MELVINGWVRTIPQIQDHGERELHSNQGPDQPSQSLCPSEGIEQRKSNDDGNAGSQRSRINSLGPESIMQVCKEEDLKQPIHHAVDGKNVADTWRIKTEPSEFYWCSKEERLHGSECNVY